MPFVEGKIRASTRLHSFGPGDRRSGPCALLKTKTEGRETALEGVQRGGGKKRLLYKGPACLHTCLDIQGAWRTKAHGCAGGDGGTLTDRSRGK